MDSKKIDPKASGTIRRYGFIGVGMASKKNCVTVELGLEVSFAQATLSVVYCSLPVV